MTKEEKEEMYDNLEFHFDEFRVDVIDMLRCDYDLSDEDAENVFKTFVKEYY